MLFRETHLLDKMDEIHMLEKMDGYRFKLFCCHRGEISSVILSLCPIFAQSTGAVFSRYLTGSYNLTLHLFSRCMIGSCNLFIHSLGPQTVHLCCWHFNQYVVFHASLFISSMYFAHLYRYPTPFLQCIVNTLGFLD